MTQEEKIIEEAKQAVAERISEIETTLVSLQNFKGLRAELQRRRKVMEESLLNSDKKLRDPTIILMNDSRCKGIIQELDFLIELPANLRKEIAGMQQAVSDATPRDIERFGDDEVDE